MNILPKHLELLKTSESKIHSLVSYLISQGITFTAEPGDEKQWIVKIPYHYKLRHPIVVQRILYRSEMVHPPVKEKMVLSNWGYIFHEIIHPEAQEAVLILFTESEKFREVSHLLTNYQIQLLNNVVARYEGNMLEDFELDDNEVKYTAMILERVRKMRSQ